MIKELGDYVKVRKEATAFAKKEILRNKIETILNELFYTFEQYNKDSEIGEAENYQEILTRYALKIINIANNNGGD